MLEVQQRERGLAALTGCTLQTTDKHTGMMNAAKERWTLLLLVAGLVAGVMGPKSGKNEWPLTGLMKEGRMF